MDPVSADAPAAWVVGNESPTALTAATQGLRPKHIAQDASNGVPYDRAYDTQRAHPWGGRGGSPAYSAVALTTTRWRKWRTMAP